MERAWYTLNIPDGLYISQVAVPGTGVAAHAKMYLVTNNATLLRRSAGIVRGDIYHIP